MHRVAIGPNPFTAAEIRDEIGLKSTALDLVIDVGIRSIINMSTKPVSCEVWAIAEDEDTRRYGRPLFVGPTHSSDLDPRMFRDVTYAADPEAVALARRSVVAWCMNQGDIVSQIGDEHWGEPTNAKLLATALMVVA